jgi:hypothetical protein
VKFISPEPLRVWSDHSSRSDQNSQILTATCDTRELLVEQGRNSTIQDHKLQVTLQQATSAIDAIGSDIGLMASHLTDLKTDIANKHVEIKTELQARNNDLRSLVMTQQDELVAAIREQMLSSLRQFLPEHGNHLAVPTTGGVRSPAFAQTAFEINTRTSTATLELLSQPPEREVNTPPGWMSGRSLLEGRRCTCRTGMSMKTSGFRRFGFRIESQAKGSCPLHGKRYSWRYYVTAHLSPLLNGIVEFSFGAFSRQGQWAIAPLLRFRATVKRSETRIFQLFDELQTFLWYEHARFDTTTKQLADLSWPVTAWFRVGSKIQFSYLQLTKDIVAKGLQSLLGGLLVACKSGLASSFGACDEDGNTLLTVSSRLDAITRILPLLMGYPGDIALDFGHQHPI